MLCSTFFLFSLHLTAHPLHIEYALAHTETRKLLHKVTLDLKQTKLTLLSMQTAVKIRGGIQSAYVIIPQEITLTCVINGCDMFNLPWPETSHKADLSETYVSLNSSLYSIPNNHVPSYTFCLHVLT